MIALYLILALLAVLIAFPAKSIRFLVILLGKLLFKANVRGVQNIPKKGGALLISNHVSFLDFALIALAVPRMVRFVMAKNIYENKWAHWILKRLNMIPISPRGGPKSLREFNKLCQDEINAGNIVVIFAEGTVTRNGHLLEFKRGMEHIASGITAPIIPIHMEGVIGSPLSFTPQNNKPTSFKVRFLRKKVFVNIGKQMPSTSSAFEVRQRIQEINAETLYNRIESHNQLAEHILKLKGNRTLFLNELEEKLTAKNFKHDVISAAVYLKKATKNVNSVGVLLENNFSMLISVCALNLLGKTPVLLNLDFTEQQFSEINNKYNNLLCIVNQKKLKYNIEKTIDVNFILDNKGKSNMLTSLLKAIPSSIALSILGNKTTKTNQAVCIPNFEKGVLEIENISHQNLIGQTYSLQQVHNTSNYGYILNLNNHKSSISLITNLILPIIAKTKSIIYNSSTRPPIELCNTIIGNTVEIEEIFHESKMEDWNNVKYIISTEQEFTATTQKIVNEKLNISIYKGMGKIGIAPIITLNTPDFTGKDIAGKILTQPANNHNSVGKPLPGLAVKITNQNNHQVELGVNEVGLVFLKGMLLSKTENDAPEWINSEMIGSIDEKGFLKIS